MGYFEDWLDNPANDGYRVWTCEIRLESYPDIYIATQNYFNPPVLLHRPWLQKPPAIEERLDSSSTISQITIVNPLNYEEWRSVDFASGSLFLAFGDVRWTGADASKFRQMFRGTIEQVTDEGDNTLSIQAAAKEYSKLERVKINDFVVDGNLVQYPISLGSRFIIAVHDYVGFSGGVHVYRVHHETISAVTVTVNGTTQTVTNNGLFAVGCFGIPVRADSGILADFQTPVQTLSQAVNKILYYANVTASVSYEVGDEYPYSSTPVAAHWKSDSGVNAVEALRYLAMAAHCYLHVSDVDTVITKIRFVQLRSLLTMEAGATYYVPPDNTPPPTQYITTSVTPVLALTDNNIVKSSLKKSGVIPKLRSIAIKNSFDVGYVYRVNIEPIDTLAQHGETLVLPMAIVDAGYSPATHDLDMLRERRYWLARMAETRQKFVVQADLNAYKLRVGNTIELDCASLGFRRHAQVTRIVYSADWQLSDVELLLENYDLDTAVIECSMVFDNNVFSDVYNYSDGAGVTGVEFYNNQGTIPDAGTGSSDRLLETATTDTHYAFKTIGSSAGNITFGGVFKSFGGRSVRLAYVSAGSAEGVWADFDLINGVATSGVNGGAGTIISATITQCTNGFWRCELKATPTASAIYTTIASRNFSVPVTGDEPVFLGEALKGIEIYAAYFKQE